MNLVIADGLGELGSNRCMRCLDRHTHCVQRHLSSLVIRLAPRSSSLLLKHPRNSGAPPIIEARRCVKDPATGPDLGAVWFSVSVSKLNNLAKLDKCLWLLLPLGACHT